MKEFENRSTVAKVIIKHQVAYFWNTCIDKISVSEVQVQRLGLCSMSLYFSNIFCLNVNVHSYNTRRANDFHTTVSLHRTSLLNTIRITRPLMWNSIDHSLLKAVSTYV